MSASPVALARGRVRQSESTLAAMDLEESVGDLPGMADHGGVAPKMVLDLHSDSSSRPVFVSTSTMRPDVTAKELRNVIQRYVALTSTGTSRKESGFVPAPVSITEADDGSSSRVRIVVDMRVLTQGTQIFRKREAEGRKAEG